MKYIIGIDEVGRGPIAGPVAVCSFICKPEFFDTTIDTPLRDSKKLTKKQREKWFEYLKEEKKKGNCDFAVSYVSAENIDKFGIVKCIQKALDTSLDKIAKQNVQNSLARRSPLGLRAVNSEHFEKLFLFLDGGLKAPKEYVNQQTIIKGDELHPVISCASIVAKVSRDKIMTDYSKEFPEYGFEKHSGYGTAFHYDTLKKHGLTVLHRKTFINLEK